MKIRALIVGLAIAGSSFAGIKPAEAFTCSPDLAEACRVVATAVCGVVAKGKPCLA